jgi:hypothetical protein
MNESIKQVETFLTKTAPRLGFTEEEAIELVTIIMYFTLLFLNLTFKFGIPTVFFIILSVIYFMI